MASSLIQIHYIMMQLMGSVIKEAKLANMSESIVCTYLLDYGREYASSVNSDH